MKEKKYDVIVSDNMMPVKDGIQFLKELREEGKKARALCFSLSFTLMWRKFLVSIKAFQELVEVFIIAVLFSVID